MYSTVTVSNFLYISFKFFYFMYILMFLSYYVK